MLVPVVLDDVSYTVGVIRRVNREDFLVVQWLRLGPMQGVQV